MGTGPEQIPAGPEAAGPEVTEQAEAQPVLESLQTVQAFIAAQKEKGNPGADSMAKALLNLIEVIGGRTSEPEAAGPAGPSQMAENAAPGAIPAGPAL